jgi:CHASE2 domain-containing sensor protein
MATATAGGGLARGMRPVLWIGAAFNVAVAWGLLVPDARLPPVDPLFHRWVLAYFVALFGAAYAWMARQPAIPRPLVALAAIGKAGVFVIALACLRRGELAPGLFAVAGIDLGFALYFLAWLRRTR